jgi:3'-phosphoadenosine 5'-phosphosulfate sulfotransferase
VVSSFFAILPFGGSILLKISSVGCRRRKKTEEAKLAERLQLVLLFPKLSKEMEQMLLEKKQKQLQQEQPQKN